MKKDKLNDKYTNKELAESFVFRNKLTANQKVESDLQLNEMRKNIQQSITPKQLLLSRLLQLKYQIEDYLENPTYDAKHSFGFFLRGYLETLNKKNKEFAKDIDIAETELSLILNKHRKPSEKVMIRLEIHSNKIIPAITWFRLLEKEKEHEILTNSDLRKQEKSHVRNMVSV
ncbi:hypothetical protein [Fluviicola taffensis]|uniref:Helix-turn-helix domain protein n=1 Tax=Fluviicola taffensis (strain DSM 16823 / NCIMB 13979 / RW262) TaxID=755732 RepID=F2IDK4_FLUTR|nr:hypothetical protein [Fluviicola taffensis]AEA43377.1 hypothetical protein Fluta_1383 [Fluviicola taffensis DSM 16823]